MLLHNELAWPRARRCGLLFAACGGAALSLECALLPRHPIARALIQSIAVACSSTNALCLCVGPLRHPPLRRLPRRALCARPPRALQPPGAAGETRHRTLCWRLLSTVGLLVFSSQWRRRRDWPRCRTICCVGDADDTPLCCRVPLLASLTQGGLPSPDAPRARAADVHEDEGQHGDPRPRAGERIRAHTKKDF